MINTAATLPIGRILLAPERRHFVQEESLEEAFNVRNPAINVVTGEGNYEAGAGPVASHPLVLQMYDPWFPTIDLIEAKNMILSFNFVGQQGAKPLRIQRIEWPSEHGPFQMTEFDLAPAFNRIGDETRGFIVSRDLTDSVAWLQSAAPRFFDGADFMIDLLPAEEGEDDLLALKVYGDFDSLEFRERRHRICEAMLQAGHKTLYEVISIFQRRVHSYGWQAVSWYGTLSAK